MARVDAQRRGDVHPLGHVLVARIQQRSSVFPSSDPSTSTTVRKAESSTVFRRAFDLGAVDHAHHVVTCVRLAHLSGCGIPGRHSSTVTETP